MKAKIFISWILQLPLILLVLASFFASIYAAYKKIAGITWATPIIIGVIVGLYLIGKYLRREKNDNGK